MEEGLSVAQPSSVVEYQSATNDGADYSMPDSTTVSEGGSHAFEYAPADGTNHGDASMYGQDATAVSQDATVGVTYGAQPDNGEVGTGENVASHENAAGVAAHAVGYDLMNGTAGELGNYQSAGVTENGNVSIEGVVPGAELSFEEVYSPEEERLWGMVRANSLDFNAWTALIEETEKVAENNILKIRKVYDAFVVEFPLCFGYWKKYADHEGRLDSIQKVVDVYERAVQAVTYSVDIWLHYCLFAISIYEDPEIIRRLFERGLAYVGTDYLSYPLWDEYIRYEESHQAWSHLAIIYTKILENPIQQLDRYLNCFKELATSRPLSEIRTADDPALLAASVDSDAHGVEGEVRPDDVEQSPKPVSAGLTEAEELEKYIAYREDLYKKAKEFESKIIDFETAIRRPYFHVRPLDDSELENWHNYLDFIEKEDDLNKAIKLYERCLIACSNYPEVWIRYVVYMETSGSLELANNALARATQAYVKKQPEIHLFAARFKELSGDVMGARMEYELLYSEIAPCLLEAIVKHTNMEYRLGNKEEAFSIYEKFIAAEQGKEQSQILPMLVVQYSRFLYLVAGNAEKAREVLSGALNHVQHSKPFLEAVIHLESIQPSSKDVSYLDSLVEKYITPSPENPNSASTTDREDVSCIFLEFLDLFGDAQSIKKADNRHTRLFSRQKRTLVSKKRQAEDLLASDNAKVHKTYTGAPSSSQSVMGAYPNAQNQWPASYGQRGPAWSQNPQAQGQQWNPGYTAQAGYSAYGYANYGHPQVPTSAPQSAAYGTYPPTYPVQAYPQQNYVQPAAAAATTTATTFPQQAPAPQQYYGSYY